MGDEEAQARRRGRAHLRSVARDPQLVNAEAQRLDAAMWANRPRSEAEKVADDLDANAALLEAATFTPILEDPDDVPGTVNSDDCDVFRLPADAPHDAAGDSGRVGRAGAVQHVDVVVQRDAVNDAPTGADYLIPESNCRTPHSEAATHDLDDVTQGTGDRLDRLARAKADAKRTAAYLEGLSRAGVLYGMRDPDDFARDLRTCGTHLEFEEYAEIGRTRLAAARFCSRHLLCPCCAIRRSAKMMRRYAPVVADVCRSAKLTPWMVTLTVKNGRDLGERFDHLRDSMRAMSKASSDYRRWRETGRGRTRRYVEWVKVQGSVYSIEITRNTETEEWHPHAHFVCGVAEGETIDVARLSADWQHQTGDSFIVDARPFHCADALATLTDADDIVDAMCGDLVEVLKYAIKFAGMEPGDVWDAFKYVHTNNRRLLGRQGEFFAWDLADDLLDAPLEVGDMPYVLAIAKYINDDYIVERVPGCQVARPGRVPADTTQREAVPI